MERGILRERIKNLLIGASGVVGGFPTKLTPRSALEGLVDRLRPLSPGIDLIRLGPSGDGGYLVPDDLDGIEACFSPGVSDVSGFEEDCANRGMTIFMADASVDGPSTAHESFHFTKKFVGATDSDDFMTMDRWVSSSPVESGSDLLLQIDVEGYEYETFLNMSTDLLGRFRVVVAEFHHLDHLWSQPFFNLAAPSIDKILNTHTCVHIHPNNCCGASKAHGLDIPRVMEFTFLRNDRVVNGTGPISSFPHPLDRDNTPNAPLDLPRRWYR